MWVAHKSSGWKGTLSEYRHYLRITTELKLNTGCIVSTKGLWVSVSSWLLLTGSRCSWETASWSSAVFISEHQDASSEGRTRGGHQGCGLDVRRSRIHMAAISCRLSDCVASWWLQMREWCASATIRLTVVPFAKLRILYWRHTLADNTVTQAWSFWMTTCKEFPR